MFRLIVDQIMKPEYKDFLENDAINFKGNYIGISRILYSTHILCIDYNLKFTTNDKCLFNTLGNNLNQLIFN